MNGFIKFIIALAAVISEINANDSFDGTLATEHFEFDIDENIDGKCTITKCTPKKFQVSDAVYTLEIPGKVQNRSVYLGTEAFNWYEYIGDDYNYSVRLIFTEQDGEYCKFPDNCARLFMENNANERNSEVQIRKVYIDFGQIDTSNVTDMTSIFHGCFGLTGLDLSTFNTSHVTNMFQMFHACYNLNTIDLSKFDTSNVTDMMFMFYTCSSLRELNFPETFDTSNVTNMSFMFNNCSSLSRLQLPANFNTHEVTDMQYMFCGCSELSELNFPKTFDTSNVTNMQYMFCGCSSLVLAEFSPAFVVSSEEVDVTSMFAWAYSNMKIASLTSLIKREFIESDDTYKFKIAPNANKVYLIKDVDENASTSLVHVIKEQLPSAILDIKIIPDYTNLFGLSNDDAVYIAMDSDEQTVVIDGADKTIAGALTNKTIDGIGYYPANLQITGNIPLSGNNFEFNQKLFIVGDGIKNTTVTLSNPKALPKTETSVEANATLNFAGTGKYDLSSNLSIKSGGRIVANGRLCIANGATVQFF